MEDKMRWSVHLLVELLVFMVKTGLHLQLKKSRAYFIVMRLNFNLRKHLSLPVYGNTRLMKGSGLNLSATHVRLVVSPSAAKNEVISVGHSKASDKD